MSDIKIHWATYGTNENAYIVTSRVQQMADLGEEKIFANKVNFGNPQEDNKKYLAIKYQVGNDPASVAACVESHSIILKTGSNKSCKG